VVTRRRGCRWRPGTLGPAWPLDGQDGSAAASERQPRGLCRWAPCQNQGKGRPQIEATRDGARQPRCCCITWRRHWLSPHDSKRLVFGPSQAKEMPPPCCFLGFPFGLNSACSIFFFHRTGPIRSSGRIEQEQRPSSSRMFVREP